MIILDATTKTLEAVLAGAVTTTQLPIVAAFVDVTTTAYTPGESDTATNNTTGVTIVAAPAAATQRQVKLLTAYNADTAGATLTVRYNNNTTLRTIVKVTLAVGSTLVYTDGEGWRVLDSSGQILTVAGGSVPTARQVISGGGLTGGGDLTVDRTLAVGAGTGITVNADDVAVNQAALKLDDWAAPDDNTDLNASTSAHGLLKKLSNVATEFLNGLGAWATPAGGTPGITTDGSSRVRQIAFDPTQSASGDANTQDDYEEGTFTPVIGGAGGTSGQTYSLQDGRYIKIGQLVHVEFRVTLSAKGTITGAVQIQGLPFTVGASGNLGAGAMRYDSLATNWVTVIWNVLGGTTAAQVVGATAAGTSNATSLLAADISNTTNFHAAMTYRASA